MKTQLPPQQLMQVINQSVQFNALVATDGTEGVAYLTPESLMAYCQSRLQGIDTQVNEAFAKQQESNAAQSALSQLSQLPSFSLPSGPLSASANPNQVKAKLDAVYADVEKAKSQMQPGSAAYVALEKFAENLQNIDVNKDMSAEEFNSQVVGGLSAIQKDLNASSELSMIGLQSLMSQRQSAVQMCTNLVQSLGDQMNKIAQNIGH